MVTRHEVEVHVVNRRSHFLERGYYCLVEIRRGMLAMEALKPVVRIEMRENGSKASSGYHPETRTVRNANGWVTRQVGVHMDFGGVEERVGWVSGWEWTVERMMETRVVPLADKAHSLARLGQWGLGE